MKKMTWMRGALALAVTLAASPAMAADHLDGPAVQGEPSADITDLFTWVDGANTVLILNTYPNANATTQFSDSVQYVFHVASGSQYPVTGTPLNVICTFSASQNISCWVGSTDYVTGNASVAGGITSTSGDVKVFAGLRDDPFFFNLGGFHDAQADVEAAASSLTFTNGCPAVNAATSAALVADISHSNHGAGPAVDFFSPSASYSGNVLSIVLSIKTTLLTSGGPILAVWASTNMGG